MTHLHPSASLLSLSPQFSVLISVATRMRLEKSNTWIQMSEGFWIFYCSLYKFLTNPLIFNSPTLMPSKFLAPYFLKFSDDLKQNWLLSYWFLPSPYHQLQVYMLAFFTHLNLSLSPPFSFCFCKLYHFCKFLWKYFIIFSGMCRDKEYI